MRFRVRSTALPLVLAALLSGVVVGTAPAAAVPVDEVYERPADGIYVIDGHGWGHGRGMSQYGALGAAGAGIGFTQILDTYYPGTAQAASAPSDMRVLLNADDGVDTVVAAAAGLAVTDIPSGGHWVLPVDPAITRWRFALAEDGTLRVQSSPNGSTWTNYAPGGIAGFGGPIQFDSAPIQIFLPDNIRRDYRGRMQAVRTSTTTMASVNVATMEEYLKGVVPRESPAWFHPEALKAQAVAARSYSAYKKAHAPATAQWDICDTTQCQVYGGQRLHQANGAVVELEQASTSAAVDATAGLIRTYKGAAIFAEFSASNGGFSVASATAPYLTAKADPWDRLDKRNSTHAWTASVPVTAIEAAYPAVGRLARVRVTSRDGNGEWGGRVLGVVLEGTDGAGRPTSVTTDGNTFYNAYDWPGRSAGMRSRWWRIRPVYDATLAVRSPDPTVVRPPARNVPSYVDLINSGITAWDPAQLRLTVAATPGSADRFTGGDRTPGSFAMNLTTGDATAVQPGQVARIQIEWNVAAVKAGAYTAAYRVVHGATRFGPPVQWKLRVVEPVFGGAPAGRPATAPAGASPAFSPQPVTSDGTVAVTRTGRTAVRLSFKNTGNVPWPVGGPVRLATSGTRNRLSPSAGPGWPSRNRVGRLAGVVGDPAGRVVAPGQTGYVDVTIFGNNRPAGTTTEQFELVWEAQAWIPRSAVAVKIARIEPRVSRVAEQAGAARTIRLVDYPRGTTTVTVRARNIGANAWRVGSSDVLGLTSPAGAALRHPSWLSATRTTRLGKGQGGADGLVYPGEIGEWQVPISAFRKGARTVTMSLRPINVASRVWYGPTTAAKVTVVPGVMAGALVKATQNSVVPRAGSRVVFMDIRNTSNVAWPIAGAVRTTALQRGGSGSRDATWLSPTRPGAVSLNVTRKGARDVRPGETARLSFRIAGNNRRPGAYAESFGVVWDGWRAIRTPVTLRYVIR